MKLCVAVFICHLSIVLSQFQPLYQRCTSDCECPYNARCRAYGCRGYRCLCDVGYVASREVTSCFIAGNVSDACDTTIQCLGGVYAYCLDRQCECRSYARRSEMGTCVSRTSAKMVGASCTPQDTCTTNAACIGGTCQCVGGYRARTADEYWTDPESREECVALDYSLGSCNGVPLPTTTPCPRSTTTPPTTTTTPTTTPTTATSTTTTPTITSLPTTTITSTATTLTTTTSTLVTLPNRAARIYENCTSFYECPEKASCTPNGCLGLNCLCDWGYAPSADRTTCLSAGNVGALCGPSVKCLTPFASCANGFCDCLPGTRRTPFYTCTLLDTKVLTESCVQGANECGVMADCQSGFCQCQAGFRRKMTAEVWADPDSSIQCVPNGFSLYTCNNMSVPLPTTTDKVTESTTPTPTTAATSPGATTATTTTSTEEETTTTDQTTTSPSAIDTTSPTSASTTLVPTTTETTTTVVTSTIEITTSKSSTTTKIKTPLITTTIPTSSKTTTSAIPTTTATTTSVTTTTTEATSTTARTTTATQITSTEIFTAAKETTSTSTTMSTTSTEGTSVTSIPTFTPTTTNTLSSSTASTIQNVNETPSSAATTPSTTGSRTSSATKAYTTNAIPYNATISTTPADVKSTSKSATGGTQVGEPIRPDDQSHGNKVAVIASACTAVIVLLIIIVIIMVFCWKRYRYKRRLEVTNTVLKTYNNVELPSAAAEYMVESQ